VEAGYTYAAMASETIDALDGVSAREAARVRARDRKRRTPMVVDNAGVRRILLHRAAKGSAPPPAQAEKR
jgi:hypothetical protein